MKKLLAIIATLLCVAFIFAGCGRNKDKDDNKDNNGLSSIVSGAESMLSSVMPDMSNTVSDQSSNTSSTPSMGATSSLR